MAVRGASRPERLIFSLLSHSPSISPSLGMMRTSLLLAPLLGLSLACNEPVEVLTSPTAGAAGMPSAQGGSGGSSAAGAGLAGSSQQAGAGQSGAAGQPNGGGGQAGSGLAGGAQAGSSGESGAAASAGNQAAGNSGGGQAGAAGSGPAGSGGLSGLGTSGCGWDEPLMATEIQGIALFTPQASQAVGLPAQNAQFPTVTKVQQVVAVTEKHLFAMGLAGSDETLFALTLDPITGQATGFQFLDSGLSSAPPLVRKSYSTDYGYETSADIYYLRQEGAGQSLRRVSREAPEQGPVTLGTDLSFGSQPQWVVPWQDGALVGSGERIAWVRPGQPVATIDVVGGKENITGLTVAAGSLYYAQIFYTGTTSDTAEGRLNRVPLGEGVFDVANAEHITIPIPGAVISYPQGGEAPEVAVVTRGGLLRVDMVNEPFSAAIFFAAPSEDFFRLDHLGYGGAYGYYVDVKCGDGYGPAFLPDSFGSSLKRRGDEPSFPFVSPTPWPTQPYLPLFHQNSHGLYRVMHP